MIDTVPARIALRYSVFPLSQENGHIKLLAPSELSRQSREELRILLGKELEFCSGNKSDIDEKIAKAYGVGAGVIETLTQEKEEESEVFDFEVIDQDREEATVTKLVNELLLDALKFRTSDIHIEPFEKSFRIRYRVDGILREARVSERIRSLAPSLISRIKIMAKLDIGEKRLPQDGRIKIKKKDEEIDIRVSVLPSSAGEAIVLRILKPLELLDFEDLGFNAESMKKIRTYLGKPHGMILVTGPTGSGKTTTLYAALKEMNDIEIKIITVEDPIEYKLPGIVQIQVHPKIDLSFAKALRSILRHDPDCIMVGEIRDGETADIAIRSALTGHLVLSTLHTNDAPSAVTRLLEMRIEPYLVSSCLHAVLAQRLVRKFCPPCEKCNGLGYWGRTVISEIMIVTDEIRSLINRREPADIIRRQAIQDGMITIFEDASQKIHSGITSPEEIQRVI